MRPVPAEPEGRPDSVVVVGAGLAGAYAAAGLRRRGYDGHLVLVGAEKHRPYDRPPLSKAVLQGAPPQALEDDLAVDLDEVCDEVLLGTRANRVEPGPLVAGDGWEEPADAVLLACGARPVVPAWWDGVLTLRTVDDAELLRSALAPGTTVVVVGAGWIGAEVAGAAAERDCDVTVVEALDTPLAREVGQAGELTRGWYEEAGVRLVTGRRVVAASGERVHLDDGERLDADVVLAAVGVTPDTEWVTGTAGGVRVGADLRAPAPLGPNVLAAGDCAVRWSPRYSMWTSGGHWDEAMLAGDAAARSLLGEDVVHDPPPYVFSTQFGREVALVGRPGARARRVLRGDPADGDGWSLGWVVPGEDGDQLVALLTVDRPRDLAQVRQAMSTSSGRGVGVDATQFAEAARPVRGALRP